MRAVLDEVRRWLAEGKPVALARVTEVVGSGVHPAGAAIAVTGDEVMGSASGGCVEGALVEEARAALAGDGRPRLRTFGCSDDEAFDVGLSCGGLVKVLIERITPAGTGEPPAWLEELAAPVRAGQGVALVEVADGPSPLLGWKAVVSALSTSPPPGAGPLPWAMVEADALDDLAGERSASHTYRSSHQGEEVEVTVFVDSFPAPPVMLVMGAASFTSAVSAQAKLLGYRVVVCDARPVFASPARFPWADEVVVDWPDRYLSRHGAALGPRDAVCVLTHDPKFDVPTIVAALATDVGYIGMIGSRRTQADRRRRLAEAGVDEAALGRLRGPIGLDLGANSPEETAVSIAAEIIAVRHGRSGGSLTTSHNPIHLSSPTGTEPLAHLEVAGPTGDGHEHTGGEPPAAGA